MPARCETPGLEQLHSYNQFEYILEALNARGKAKTKKGLAHQVVGLIAELDPRLAFEKYVLPAQDIPGLYTKLYELFEIYGESRSIGVATCLQNTREGMGKNPYWYGQKASLTRETLTRFIEGESEENGYWDITDEERKKYPWLVNGFRQSLSQYSIEEVVVTVHPPGYDEDRRTHFVGRIFFNRLQMLIETALGTTSLRQFNEQTSQYEIIMLDLQNNQMKIGVRYLLEVIIEHNVTIRELTEIIASLLQTTNFPLEKRMDIFKKLFNTIWNFCKTTKFSTISQIPMKDLISMFSEGLDMGISIMKHPQKNKTVQITLYEMTLDALKKVALRLPEKDEELKAKVQKTVRDRTSSVQETFLPEGSDFLLQDLLEVIKVLGFTQIEIIGGVTPNGKEYAKIYEVS